MIHLTTSACEQFCEDNYFVFLKYWGLSGGLFFPNQNGNIAFWSETPQIFILPESLTAKHLELLSSFIVITHTGNLNGALEKYKCDMATEANNYSKWLHM